MFSGMVEVFTRIICRTYLEKPLPKQYSILLNWFIFSLFYRLTFFTLSFRRYFSSRDLTFKFVANFSFQNVSILNGLWLANIL